MKIRNIITTIIILAVTCIPAVAANEYDNLMVKVNYHYTLALLSTSQQDKGAASLHIDELSKVWNEVILKYREQPPAVFAKDKRWANDVTDIAGCITVGKAYTDADRLTDAHDALERIRHIIRGLRERNGVPELADKLTEYHDIMEPIVLTAKNTEDKSAAIKEIKKLLPKLKASWKRVTTYYNKMQESPVKTGLAKAIENETSTISGLEHALRIGDTPAALKNAQKLKPSFMELFVGQAQIEWKTLQK